MTVAAFMAVAAVSYAAETPKNAGYEFTVAKDATEASQVFSLKKGTYTIAVTEGSFSVDGNALTGDLVVEASKEYTIKVTLPVPAGEGGKEVTLTITPTTAGWTTWLADQQTIITNLMSEASLLGKGDGDPLGNGDGDKAYMTEADKKKEAGWRTDLITRISAIQKAKNDCGIEEYNEWVDKESVTSLAGLAQLKSDVNDKTANHNAYKAALSAFAAATSANGDLDYSELTTKYNDSEAKSYFTDTYNTLKKDIDGVEAEVWDVYIAGNAAANYDAQKLSAKISDLKSRIDNLSAAITNGSTQYANWSAVENAVEDAISIYNTQFNSLYSQLAASTLPKGYGKETYNDYYEDAVKELNETLAKIYAVKNANDTAKMAYDASESDDKPAINGLDFYKSAEWKNAGNKVWADDNFEEELKAVYTKYIFKGDGGPLVAAGDKDATAITTLRGAYRTHVATIASLRSALSAFDAAKADKDTDKDGKDIGKYFTGKVNEITNLIEALETKVEASNAINVHTITSFNIDTEGKTGIDTKKAFLDTQKDEYDKYVATRGTISTLENTTFKNAKDVVNTKEYHDFKANERFSKAAIETAISEFKKAARNNYKVENGNGMADAYNRNACETTNSTIEGQINTWKTAAIDAYNKYKAIYDAIAAYELEITGRAAAEGVEEIKSWDSVVLDENVTVGNIVPSDDTYGSRKVAADLVKENAQSKLNDAMNVARNDASKEKDFVDKLTAAWDERSNVGDKTTEIRDLKTKYASDQPVWQAKTSYQAADDAKKESQSMLDASNTDANAIPAYLGTEYGTKAAETLNEETTRIKGLLTEIQTEIDAVTLPKDYTTFDQNTAATAIAQINEIKEKLAVVGAYITKLKDTTAPSAKANFDDVKTAIDNIKDNINGRAASQGVTKIESINELLVPATNPTISAAITTFQNEADQLLTDLNAAPDVADARKDIPAEGTNPAVDGLDTRCKNLLASVNDYRTKAENESKNQKNKNAWDAFLLNPYGKENAQAADAAQAIIYANKVAIDDALANSTSLGEEYFQKLIGDGTAAGKQKDFNTIKSDVDDLYGKKLQAPDNAFTDPANNLTDSKLTEKKNAVLAILDEVKTYPSKAKTNEEAYAAQGTKYNEVLANYNELRLEISAAKPSGNKFTESYNKALDKLTTINDALETYFTNKNANYAQGASEAFDAKATLSNINAIDDKITTLKQKWNADETTEDSYLKAVADDNAARYAAFLTALDGLKEAYFGKTVGSEHTDGAIDVVSKLSNLSYSGQVNPNDFEKLVEGKDGIYKYADKIEDLAQRASENKGNTKAPAFWDIDGGFAAEAGQLQSAVISKRDAYAALVNNIATNTYLSKIGGVETMLNDARTALKASGVELAANDAKADVLLDAVKSASLSKGAVSIYNDAVAAYNGGTPVVDFAYKLDREFLPGFAEVETLIANAKDKAARESWEAMCGKVNTVQDATDMRGFMWYWNYANSTNLGDFEKGTAPNDFGYNTIEYDNTFDGYADAKREYNLCVITRTIGRKDQTHTKEYWAAYDSNEKYNILKAADQALQFAIKTLTGNLDAAEAAIKSLLVEHDENLATLIASYRGSIDCLDNANNQGTIQDKINGLNEIAIRKEMQAVNIELTNMRSYIELNIAEADRLALVEKTNELQTKNEKIYALFSVGTGVPPVKATAEATYSEYQKIEKEIGALKTTFDTTVANAAAEIAAAIEKLEENYSALVTEYEATFQQTQSQYATAYAAIKSQIDAVKAKVDAQGDAISIEKGNNLKAVDKANTAISSLSADLKAYNQDYVDNDNFVKAQLLLLEEYENTDLVSVVAKGESLKNKRLFNPKQQDSPLYVTSDAERIKKSINGYEENSIIYNGVKDDLNDLINYVKKSNYSTKKQSALSAVNGIHNDIVSLEKAVLKYDLTAESQNVLSEIQSVQAEIEARIPDGAELRNTLTGNVTTQNGNKSDVDDFMKKVCNEGYMDNGSWVSLDIVAEHQGVMDRYAGILNALADIQDDIVTPGAVGDLENVTSRDINAIIGFILDPSTIGDKLSVADIDGDKEITVADLIKVQNYYLYNNYSGFTPKAGMSAVRGVVSTNLTAGTLDMDINGSFLSVSLDTKMGYAAIQLDVTLPSGVALTDAAFAGAIEGVQVMHNKIGENTWRVLLFSEDNSNLVDGADLLSVSLAGQGVGTISVNNAKGSTTRGILVPIPGDSEEKEISTGIDAPAEIADGSSFFYNVNAAVQRSIEKGITIVKEAGNKVKKVFSK